MKTQKCSKCGKKKAVSQFSINRAMRTGLNKQCKACRAAYDKEWQNRPGVREAHLAYMRRVNNARYAADPTYGREKRAKAKALKTA